MTATSAAGRHSGSAAVPAAAEPYLAPIEKPRSLMVKLAYLFARRQFGKVPRPFSVFVARMPTAFMSFYGKVSKLDRKLVLPAELALLVRERVNSVNLCLWCMDAGRWYTMHKAPGSLAKLEAIHEYRTSPLFDDRERAALDFATELTETRHVAPATFAAAARHWSEREICDLVWLVASEHLYNVTNLGLNIESDGLCELAPSSARAVPAAPAAAQGGSA